MLSFSATPIRTLSPGTPTKVMVTAATLILAWWGTHSAFGETSQASQAALVTLNEVLADPPPDLAGDANGDGVRSSTDDEFVEIYNAGSDPMDLTGWKLHDSTGLRHEFESGLVLGAGEFYVVFGGGIPTGIPSRSTAASTGGLSLNNTSDEVKLLGPDDSVRDSHMFGPEGNEDQSMIRFPDGMGGWTLPDDVGLPWDFSPGKRNESPTSIEGSSWAEIKAHYREAN